MEGSQVVDIKDPFYWSLSQLSKAFGPARETIGKRLDAAGITSDRKKSGHDVYHIADAARAILQSDQVPFNEIRDPEKLPPKDRLDWYKGNNEKNKFEREAKTLIPEQEVSTEIASVVKTCVRTIETLPDILEMKCQLPPDVIQVIERECDQVRELLAIELEK